MLCTHSQSLLCTYSVAFPPSKACHDTEYRPLQYPVCQEVQVQEVSSTGPMCHEPDLELTCHDAALPDGLRLSCIVLNAAKHTKEYSAVGYAWYTKSFCGVSSVAQWELQLHALS